MQLKLVDLFCGAGGLSLGLQQAGMTPIFAADNDPHACDTYRANVGDHVHHLDLGVLPPEQLAAFIHKECGEVDVVAGGPPCQGFSVQRRGSAIDPRNDLAIKFGLAAAEIRPKAIVLENVPTILGPRGKDYRSQIFQIWEDADFVIHKAVLEAAAYGVPQMRRRAFLVAIRRELRAPFVFPPPRLEPRNYVTVRNAFAGLPPPPSDFSEHSCFPNHKLVAISPINIERISYVPEGGGRMDVPASMQLPCHKKSNGHRHLDVFGRLWWDRPSGTITAMFDNFTRGRFGHPTENRNITGREGARLQSFPDDFVFLGPKKDVARQIGNAVAPRLAQAVGEALINSLENVGFLGEQPLQRMLPFGN